MSNLKDREEKKRILSIDRKKLTLSGSKVSISSLSSSLIKFFEAEEGPACNGNREKYLRHKKAKSTYMLNLNAKPIPSYGKKELPSLNVKNETDDYGILSSKDRKQPDSKLKNFQQISQWKKVKSRVSSVDTNQMAEKENRMPLNNQGAPYFNFTFGKQKLKFEKMLKITKKQ